MKAAFDHAYSVGILRVRSGLDFSAQIKSVETETEEGKNIKFLYSYLFEVLSKQELCLDFYIKTIQLP